MLSTIRKIAHFKNIRHLIPLNTRATALPFTYFPKRNVYYFSSSQNPKDDEGQNKTSEKDNDKKSNQQQEKPKPEEKEDQHHLPGYKHILVIMLSGLVCGFLTYQYIDIGSTGQKILEKHVKKNQESNEVSKVPFGGTWELIDTDGNPFGYKQLEGTHYLIYFGFTKCPDICPTTLFYIFQMIKSLRVLPGGDAVKLKVVFVSVDPERDTPEVMKKYLSHFGADFIGVTASNQDDPRLKDIKKKFKIYANRVQNKENPESYNVDHTSLVFMMNEKNRFVDVVNTGLSERECAYSILKKIQTDAVWSR